MQHFAASMQTAGCARNARPTSTTNPKLKEENHGPYSIGEILDQPRLAGFV